MLEDPDCLPPLIDNRFSNKIAPTAPNDMLRNPYFFLCIHFELFHYSQDIIHCVKISSISSFETVNVVPFPKSKRRIPDQKSFF